MSGLFDSEPFAQIRGQLSTEQLPDLHPDLLAVCRCGYRAYEHDPMDMRCPSDEGEAALNREDQAE